MQPLTEDVIRAAIVNATPDEIDQIEMPVNLFVADWPELDFFAWRDPVMARRGYVVVERDGEPVGIMMTATDPNRIRAGLCNMCRTMQPGNQVSLFTARKAGDAGRRGDSVGTYMCTDLSCHDTVRLAPPLAPSEVRDVLHIDHRAHRTLQRVRGFVDQVLAGVEAPAGHHRA